MGSEGAPRIKGTGSAVQQPRPQIVLYNRPYQGMLDASWLDPELRCEFSVDRDRLAEAAAVLFHLPTLGTQPLPPRPAGQIWVAWFMESAANHPLCGDIRYLSRFDLVMCHRRDADVWIPYFTPGTADEMRTPPREKTERAPAVCFQSSPINHSGRIEYLAELSRHLRVDSYGQVLRNRALGGADRGRATLLETIACYRFTLAFENSIEEDYVTEKFFDPLVAGSVPVYLGAPNVADFAPGDRCYINVGDYAEPHELARYLNHLCREPHEYEGYLAWKQTALRNEFLRQIEAIRTPAAARLCCEVAH
jgi:alpha-1,3-fucosyltransferase 10